LAQLKVTADPVLPPVEIRVTEDLGGRDGAVREDLTAPVTEPLGKSKRFGADFERVVHEAGNVQCETRPRQ
jgi:hypothetical protein